jgi:hypothetical protein
MKVLFTAPGNVTKPELQPPTQEAQLRSITRNGQVSKPAKYSWS